MSATNKTVDVKGVGPVLFERSRRAKRIIISVKSCKEVRVAVPYRSSFKKAEEFASTKTDWIKKQMLKIKRHQIERYHVPGIPIDREEVRTKLIERLKWLANKHEYSYNRVFIRNQKTRWGSCSHKNNISLNAKLVRLPDELADYVILHELTHTKKKDHSKAFWAELDKLVGNGKRMSSRLKRYSLG